MTSWSPAEPARLGALGFGSPFLDGSVLGWPFPEGTASTGVAVLVFGSAPAAPGLARTLRMIFPSLISRLSSLRSIAAFLASLVASLAMFCLRRLGHDFLGRFLAVDLDRVDVDDQLSVEQRCLEIGFAVQIAAFDHRQGKLIKWDAHPPLELVSLDFDVDLSFQLGVFVDQGVHVVAAQDEGLDRRSVFHGLAKCLHSVLHRLTFLGRHFDRGKLLGRSGRVLVDQPIEQCGSRRRSRTPTRIAMSNASTLAMMQP